MQKTLNVGDPVRFDYIDEQISYEKDFKIPFTVAKTEKKDLYSSGLPMECWETVITVQDANGEIVAEVEDDALILLDKPQTEPTSTDNSEEIPAGTNEMIAVSRLDNYYSRNGIKTNLDDDEE